MHLAESNCQSKQQLKPSQREVCQKDHFPVLADTLFVSKVAFVETQITFHLLDKRFDFPPHRVVEDYPRRVAHSVIGKVNPPSLEQPLGNKTGFRKQLFLFRIMGGAHLLMCGSGKNNSTFRTSVDVRHPVQSIFNF